MCEYNELSPNITTNIWNTNYSIDFIFVDKKKRMIDNAYEQTLLYEK
jgi:hypothetical protein